MDFLLIIYLLLFISILLFPFAFMAWKYKDERTSPFGLGAREDVSNLKEEKEILLANLGDLKAEEETGKMKDGEFRNLSKDILLKLQEIDERLLEINKDLESGQDVSTRGDSIQSEKKLKTHLASGTLVNDKSTKTLTKISFCPQCGTQALSNAKFCHNCGVKF